MDKGKICKIRDIYRAIAEMEMRFQKRFGLNINEAMLLCMLQEQKGITAGELTKAMGLTHSNMSKVIRSVEKRKFVSRSFDKNDKRMIHFAITKVGMEQLETIKCSEIDIPEMLNELLS